MGALEQVGGTTINATCSEPGGLIVGDLDSRICAGSSRTPHRWRVMTSDQASRRLYIFPMTTGTSLVPSSDTPCDLPNSQLVLVT